MTSQYGGDNPTYDINPMWELRVIVPLEQNVKVSLLQGQVECFGTNLSQSNQDYILSSGSYSFFSWTGASVALIGSPSTVYLSNDSSIPIYANLHYELNKDRLRSVQKHSGPVAMVLGGANVGKTAMIQTLSHWALRNGWTPTYVDLNVSNPVGSLPGAISAFPVELQSQPHALDKLHPSSPLSYFYGHTDITENPSLYVAQCRSLAQMISLRISATQAQRIELPGLPPTEQPFDLPPPVLKQLRYSGTLIDTPAQLSTTSVSSDFDNLAMIAQLCKIFKVDVLLIIDNELLHAQLTNNIGLQRLGTAIAKIPRFQGAVNHDPIFKAHLIESHIRTYFYGYNHNLLPVKRPILLDKICVFQTQKQQSLAMSSLLSSIDESEEFERQRAQLLKQENIENNNNNDENGHSIGNSNDINNNNDENNTTNEQNNNNNNNNTDFIDRVFSTPESLLTPISPHTIPMNSIVAISYKETVLIPGSIIPTLEQQQDEVGLITQEAILGFIHCTKIETDDYGKQILHCLWPTDHLLPNRISFLSGTISWTGSG